MTEDPHEQTPLLADNSNQHGQYKSPVSIQDIERQSTSISPPSSCVTKEEEEQLVGDTAVGEILPYNAYSSIDFLHDLVSTVPIYSTTDKDPRYNKNIGTHHTW